MRSFDPGVTFHDYASAFRDSGPYRVAPQVKNIIESYTLELDCAVFAVRDGAVFGWWLDDRHAYLALELPGAAGGPNGDIEIISLARPAFSEVAAPTPSPPLEVKLARLLDKIADLSSSTPHELELMNMNIVRKRRIHSSYDPVDAFGSTHFTLTSFTPG